MKSVYISLVAFAISLLLTVFVTGGADDLSKLRHSL